MNKTVIEANNVIRKRGRPGGILNRSRSNSTARRNSSTSRSENGSGNEEYIGIAAWLEKAKQEKESEKRKAENPEHGGKDPKRKK